jgi:hypothetical protein
MSKGVTVVGACCVLAAAVFVGLAAKAPTRAVALPRVGDAAGTFSVAVPAGWQVDASGTLGTVLFLFGPQYDDFKVNVSVGKQQVGKMSLAEYLAVSKKGGPGMMPEYKELSEGSTTLGGLRAAKLVYEGKPLGKDMQFMAVFTVKDGVAYVLTYTAPSPYCAKHLKEFQAVVKSFTWTKRDEPRGGASPPRTTKPDR